MDSRIDPHTLTILEFDKVRNLLAQFAISEVGREFCEKTAPLTNASKIRERLNEVSELKQFIELQGHLPLNNLESVTRLIKKAHPRGVFLSPAELLQIKQLVEASRITKALLRESKVPCPTLTPLITRLTPMISLETAITRAIGPDGAISDTASSALGAIRAKVRQTKQHIRSRLEEITNKLDATTGSSGTYITLRNDRYVIPVRSDVKKQVPGVVHDQSKHLATFFIEPLSIVDHNNALLLLKQDEKEEEIAILESLTDLVRDSRDTLIKNQRHLAILDCIQARARLSAAMNARAPEVLEDGNIHIRKARHPLLLRNQALLAQERHLPAFDNDTIVPIELTFPRRFSVAVITGANMGGKTAALKTVGLLTLMVQAGMHVPVAEGSRVSVWQRIFADIGDEQSLEKRVSTFSSHVSHLIHILRNADNDSLVLLDEIGSGTDPQEGAALALAIIEHLSSRSAKILVTSHLSLLKSYAATSPHALTVSVAFDTSTLQPTYELRYGIPGTSKAFETAASLGIDKKILEQAASYLDETDRQARALIDELRNQLEAIHQSQDRLREAIRRAGRYEDAVRALSEMLVERKTALYAQIEKKARALFRDIESRLKQAMKVTSTPVSKSNLKEMKNSVAALKHDLATFLPQPVETPQDLGVIQKGDHLKLGTGGQRAHVLDIDMSTNTVEVQVGGMRLKARIDELAKIEGIEKQEHQSAHQPPATWSPSETAGPVAPLKVIGLTIEEALPLVEKALDHALLVRQKELRIIHGFGTGRLRTAIHDYLQQHSAIRGFHLADRLEGGGGTTVVELDV